MNPAEYYELQIAVVSLFSLIFEIWMGFTFAAIVGFHFAAPHLNKVMLNVGILLYVAASLLFATRYAALATVFSNFNQMLIDAGHDPFPAPSQLQMLGFSLTVFVFAAGSISTIWYSLHRHKSFEHGT